MKINYEQIENVLKKEENLIRTDNPGRLVFVGDTHGDLQASKTVLNDYFDQETTLIFLGDYVDRGPNSEENLNFLLRRKLDHPNRLILLQGNHEGLKYRKFSPVDFWNGLSPGKREKYRNLLAQLPLAFTWNGLIATHGGLPDVKGPEEINEIEGGSGNWEKITWGDLNEVEGYVLGGGFGRPQLGSDYFNQSMQQLGKNVLIRSHQPNTPTYMFDHRCVTIFSSSAYGTNRIIAIAEEEAKSGRDVTIKEL